MSAHPGPTTVGFRTFGVPLGSGAASLPLVGAGVAALMAVLSGCGGEAAAGESVLVDALGYLWVRPGLPADAPPTRDVFDPEGRCLGPVALPLELQGDPLRITTERIYGVHSSELGVPYVVVLGLDRADDG